MSNLIIDTTLNLWQSGRRVKRSGAGWLSGNAVCCTHNNQNADRRGRGGIIVAVEGISYSCFNCNFKCGYRVGGTITTRFKSLLEWLGADKITIDKLTLEAMKIAAENAGTQGLVKRSQPKLVSFHEIALPEGSELLDHNNPLHKVHIDYLASRGLDTSYGYYCTPEATGRNRDRIIIPYYYKEQLIGNTSRFYDDRKPKYIQESQRGYVFNIDNQKKEWEACILVEGQFDALSIGGCAYMGSTINDEQATLINRLNRRIIVVPDRDVSGMAICERALELGYQVSLPEWHDSVKDVNDAVLRYGKLATLLSIMQSTTTNKIKIEMARKQYK